MKPNTALLNKQEKDGITTFTVWTDRISQITSFIDKAVSIKGMPEVLNREHDVGMGYWADVAVPTATFEQVITNIKNVFKNDTENVICEHFEQTTWGADMLYH